MRRRTAGLEALNHLELNDHTHILTVVRVGRAIGVVSRDSLEELIAELHPI